MKTDILVDKIKSIQSMQIIAAVAVIVAVATGIYAFQSYRSADEIVCNAEQTVQNEAPEVEESAPVPPRRRVEPIESTVPVSVVVPESESPAEEAEGSEGDTSVDGDESQSAQVENEPATLTNPTRYPVAFLIDDVVFNLEPGDSMELPPAANSIRFHRGGEFGEDEVTVLADVPSYTFAVSREEGWQVQTD